MMRLPSATRIYVACGVSDMRRGLDGLCAQIEGTLKLDPYGGAVFIFRGKRGDLIKALHWDGQGLVLYSKRLEKGRFVISYDHCQALVAQQFVRTTDTCRDVAFQRCSAWVRTPE